MQCLKGHVLKMQVNEKNLERQVDEFVAKITCANSKIHSQRPTPCATSCTKPDQIKSNAELKESLNILSSKKFELDQTENEESDSILENILSRVLGEFVVVFDAFCGSTEVFVEWYPLTLDDS
eukprot:CAMPEP_0172520138 /NCGR_PEP_ID=MMETSP1066-20121228/291818_1 /TAXON_ID=671091 /ORGANISM="Coscinodiscus wailesii, Strain CCMP2513" /LENGTH=122 /DNA_ID=CAMNT_0013302845 /DNA_START=1613 /DNA_END=1982 /DNA_ORIENTATION=-